MIYYEAGTPVSYDQSQADSGNDMTVTRSADASIVMIGEEQYFLPDAIIFGG